MAKIADYVQKQDQVTKELEAVASQPAKTSNIPESVKTRFAGKTPEEIMESFAEAQALISRQGQELGELRKTAQILIELQSTTPQQEPAKPAKPEKRITSDDLYDNPEGTIATVVQKESQKTSERVEALEKELAKRTATEIEVRLESKYKGWKQEIANPEFLDWVKESPIRVQLAVAANNWNEDSANDLLERWYERKGIVRQAQAQVEREQQFRNASLESSSPVDIEQVPTYSRHELEKHRMAAKHGNRTSEAYLKAHGPAITQAYREGRITD